jgi:hypothetical protein
MIQLRSARRKTLRPLQRMSHLLKEIWNATLGTRRRGVEHVSDVQPAEQRAIAGRGLARDVKPGQDAHSAGGGLVCADRDVDALRQADRRLWPFVEWRRTFQLEPSHEFARHGASARGV